MSGGVDSVTVGVCVDIRDVIARICFAAIVCFSLVRIWLVGSAVGDTIVFLAVADGINASCPSRAGDRSTQALETRRVSEQQRNIDVLVAGVFISVSCVGSVVGVLDATRLYS